MALTPREKLFVTEYLVDRNGTQAYMRAFKTKNKASAAVSANRLLNRPNIQAALEAAFEKQMKRVEWSADDVLLQLRRMVELDVRKMYDENGLLLPVAKMPDEVAFAIQGVEHGKDGIKFRFADRNVAVSNALKHFGLLKDKVEVEAGESLRDILEQAHAQTQAPSSSEDETQT